MACLLSTQQVPGPPHLQIFHRDAGAATQIGGCSKGGQAIVRSFADRKIGVIQQIGVAAFAASTDATAQLMQLREPVTIGAIHNQSVRIGDIETGFNDGGGNQNIETTFPEVDHDPFEVRFGHLTVGGGNTGLRDQLLNPLSNPRNR